MSTLKLAEIAERIDAHLKRLEQDPTVNFRKNEQGQLPFYKAQAVSVGRYVGVRYVSYQATANLSKHEALRYLEALDGGVKEKHFTVLRDK